MFCFCLSLYIIRTHQIRVHLKERRTPIIGDEAYGSAEWNKLLLRADGVRRPLLHAHETEFIHPFTNEKIIIRAPVPSDMAKVLSKLTVENKPLLDKETSLLIGSTEVRGREAGEKDRIGFVPSDRVIQKEEEWTSFDLPETLDEMEAYTR